MLKINPLQGKNTVKKYDREAILRIRPSSRTEQMFVSCSLAIQISAFSQQITHQYHSAGALQLLPCSFYLNIRVGYQDAEPLERRSSKGLRGDNRALRL